MINSLKGIGNVEGHIIHWGEISPKDLGNIVVDDENDLLSFKVMTKPASEGGEGCQWTALVATGLEILKNLNKKFPCRENALTITKLEEALMWQEKRTKDRVKRGVEGADKL